MKVSYYDFGAANIIIALLIATMKASLVATFFMHLRHDKLFNTLAFLSAFLFLGIFILLTYDDLGRRGQYDPDYGGKVDLPSGIIAPGGEPATSATSSFQRGPKPRAHREQKRRSEVCGRPTRRMRRRAAVTLLSMAGCERKHVPVDAIPELGYPACGDSGADDGSTFVEGHLRSGPVSTEKTVVERFEILKTACDYVLRSRQEWPLQVSDVEIHYDQTFAPFWAWKRMTIPGSKRVDGNADLRRYEMRTGDVFIKHRDADGQVTLQHLLPGGRMSVPQGARVGAVVGPGRGMITAWLKHAKLPIGGKTYDLVLDMRDVIERVELGTLERQADQYEPDYGKGVRVYTFFGRETVFADESDVVIGDLAGMRPSDRLATPEPPPMPLYGSPQPALLP